MPGSKNTTVIALKLEATSGTDSVPTVAADAVGIRVSNLKVKIDQVFAERDVLVGSFEAVDKLPYTRRAKITFSVELQASGTLGTAPAWGKALQACGFSEAVTATTRVDYLPASASLKTASIYAWVNGRLEKFIYCAGSCKFSLANGSIPSIDFEFTGLVGSVAANAQVTPTLTAWIRAEAASQAATTPLSIGPVTYSAGALTGGTTYSWKSLEIDTAGDVQHVELVGPDVVGVYGRSPKAMMVADFGGTAHAAFKADMHAGTTRAFGLVHGSAAGKKVGIYAPVGVIDDMDDDEQGPVLLDKMGMTLRPSTSNDSLRIFCV